MLSFEKGKPVAIIKGGKYNGEIVHITDDKGEDKMPNSGYNDVAPLLKKQLSKLKPNDIRMLQLCIEKGTEPLNEKLATIYRSMRDSIDKNNRKELNLNGGQMVPIPNPDTRDCIYVCGPSGSGKSTYVSKYAEQYKKMFPDNKIVLFSRVEEDEALDKLDPIRFDLSTGSETSAEILEDPIEPSDLENSLVIFDDTDTLPDKKVKDAIIKLKDDLLQTGRHQNVYVAITSHQLSNYKETRNVLNECHSITIFPKSGSTFAIKYVLKNYFGLDPQDIKRILDLPSRWVTITKTFPQSVIYDSGIYLLSQ
jgi:GTPase SAR1 family protein